MSAPAEWVVLFRHGHSEWNLSDRFTGWTDIPLTEVGLAEAAAAGRRLAQAGFAFDEVHGSVLQRTRQTVEALLAYWNEVLRPRLAAGRRLLVVSHGNTLRGLVMHLDGLSAEAMEKVGIPSGVPLVYRFASDLSVAGREWLDVPAVTPAA